jgi:DNA processing protein
LTVIVGTFPTKPSVTPLDAAYPRTHAALQARIAREHLVVSPYSSGTPMARWHFPRRNRLMAQLSRATLLVEAGPTSGTRHQVDACVDLGRAVFAHTSLLHAGIDWLDRAHARGAVRPWSTPNEAIAALDRLLAA